MAWGAFAINGYAFSQGGARTKTLREKREDDTVPTMGMNYIHNGPPLPTHTHTNLGVAQACEGQSLARRDHLEPRTAAGEGFKVPEHELIGIWSEIRSELIVDHLVT
jgi:hypothetical protein